MSQKERLVFASVTISSLLALFLFLLANGIIVSRRSLVEVNVPHFDFTPKTPLVAYPKFHPSYGHINYVSTPAVVPGVATVLLQSDPPPTADVSNPSTSDADGDAVHSILSHTGVIQPSGYYAINSLEYKVRYSLIHELNSKLNYWSIYTL